MDAAQNDLPRNRQELSDRIEASWRAWVDAVEGIPDDRLGEPAVGHWSTKDLLGHVAYWEDWAVAYCQRAIAGEPQPDEDIDGMNQGQVAASKDASAAGQKRYRDEAHARLTAFLATLRDDEPQFPQLAELLGDETWGHYDEHTDQVRAWRTEHAI